MGDGESCEVGAWKHKTAEALAGHDVRRRRHPKQGGDLAEIVARPHHRSVDPVDHNAGGSFQDHEEVRAGQALAQDSITYLERLFAERIDQALAFGRRQVSKKENPDRMSTTSSRTSIYALSGVPTEGATLL